MERLLAILLLVSGTVALHPCFPASRR